MRGHFKWVGILGLVMMLSSLLSAQNRNFMVGYNIGIGNSGFAPNDQSEDDLNRLFHPVAGIQIHKKLSDKLALLLYPNVSLSGNTRIFKNPIGNITSAESRSAFVNFSALGKYFGNEKTYLLLGPEIAYLLWNQGSTYDGDILQNKATETYLFKRINWLATAGLGYSTKISESRKNVKLQIDVLWYLEFRVKKGVTNILSDRFPLPGASATSLSFEFSTGIYFASKK